MNAGTVFTEIGIPEFAGREHARCAWCGEWLHEWAWVHPHSNEDDAYCSIHCCERAWLDEVATMAAAGEQIVAILATA